jgi:pimeloyl-ACP methyl ester carboxylesterase
MTDTVIFKNTTVRYKHEGSGTAVVLLHGYLESLDIWNKFSDQLSEKFSVVSIDLPGHGQSGILSDTHTMELMAEAVEAVLNKLQIDKCVLIGHSMGGYVTMAFTGLFNERLFGYSLFHSTPFADNEEKKKNRNREIDLVNQGKKDLIFKTNVPKAFADDNHEILKNEIERAIEIAYDTPKEGIKAVLEGMKLRSDRHKEFMKSKIPVLLILGKKDNYISFNAINEKISPGENVEIFVLKNSGHMGFIEEPEKSVAAVTVFVEKCIK